MWNEYFKKLFLFNKNNENDKELNNDLAYKFTEIAKIVKESRIQQNLTVKELSHISRIPERTIFSIENNNKNIRPQYPFIKSILIKLEECLKLKKNTLVNLAISEQKTFKREKKEFLFRKFDLINTWQGSILYFLMLVIMVFLLKRYFVLNVKVIEIQSIENKIIGK